MKKLYLLLSFIFFFGVSQAQLPDVINFDDLPGTSNPIPQGYAGFSWTYTAYYLSYNTHPGSGYDYGATSKPNVGFTAYAEYPFGFWLEEPGATFKLGSLMITAAWTPVTFYCVGKLDDQVVYTSQNFVANTTVPLLVELNWTDIDEFMIYNVGYAEHLVIDDIVLTACQTKVTAMTLQTTTDPYGTWLPVTGNLVDGFNMACAAKKPWYYFDIKEMAVDKPLKPNHLNPFYLAGSYPSSFWSYWNDKGVNSSAVSGWQKDMWDIINGVEPAFYVYLQNSDYRLIDALTLKGAHQLMTDFHWPGDISGDEYAFKGTIQAGDETNMCNTLIKLKLGDEEPPVIANCGESFDLPLVRSAVRTRFGITIDYVATLSQAVLTGLVTDNCGIKSVTASKTNFNRMDIGENVVTLTATDYAGHVTSCQVTVYVYMPGMNFRSGEIGSNQMQNTVIADELSLQLYPNPTTGKVNIFLNNLNNPEVSVKLFNSTGGMVIDRMVTTDGPVELDLTGKVSGIYLLKVAADEREFIERIVLKGE